MVKPKHRVTVDIDMLCDGIVPLPVQRKQDAITRESPTESSSRAAYNSCGSGQTPMRNLLQTT